ncbi:Aminopeptidase 2 mitochondrial [Mortierella sp. AD032]|nr:Aminopeptidase 2 mitochondrial [Mortierella sp. AD032]
MTLERSIIPIHYNLKIIPCPITFSFLGECSIEICIAEPTFGITINAKELNIQKATARDHLTDHSVTATSVSYHVEDESITLEFPEMLHIGTSWILEIAYIGIINDKLSGFYRSVYTDADNNPSIKATFTLTLVAPQGMTCLSNMSVDSTINLEGGMQEVTFLKTPIMATYLLAWMIGDLEYIEAYTSGDFSGEQVCCRLYAPIGLATHGQYSLDLAIKLDLVAVPDFSPGAMENWGLITFRTYAVLLDEHATNDRQREIAATVIHEISHQWFGNLVTMDWWSDLWLFEGFATHLAYIVVDDLFPAWDAWSEFVIRVQHVLKQDALRTSHPVEVGVVNPSEITQIFDEVSYMKGASVLRMLSGWLGQDQLLRGIRKFMLRYMWGNANTDDLWHTLAEECQADVPEFMRRWTRQTGYPVLTITEIDESTILVRQSLFLSTGDIREGEDDQLWPIPLALATADDPAPKNIMMTTKELILTVDTTQWYKFNMGQAGFYRVSYPSRALDLLGQTLKSGKETETLKTADRVGLLTDAAALVAAGVSPTSSFLTLLKYFEDEESSLVWSEISMRMQELVSVWLEQPEPVVNAIKEVQRRLFKNIVKRLGWTYPEGEDPAIGNLRALAIRFAGRANDPEVVSEARRRFAIFMANRDASAIPPDLMFPVFEIVLKTTVGLDEYEAVMAFYRETYSPGEKVVALTVIGYGDSPEMIQRTLAFSMSEEVRNADILSALMTLRSSVMGRAELWNFMRQHWDVLYERHFDDLRFVEYFILFSIGMFSTAEKYQEVQDFFANKDTSQCDRILANCMEGIRTRILWLERDQEDVEVWLKANGYLGTAPLEEGVGENMSTLIQDHRSRHASPLRTGHGLQLSLAGLGRSRSGSSVDGLSPETNDTRQSVPSATSSCSSSPPTVYLEHPECQQQNHLYHTHDHHHHHHHQHERGQEQHRHQQQEQQHHQQQHHEQHSRSQVYLDESAARLIDERFQLSHLQQEQQELLQKNGGLAETMQTTTATTAPQPMAVDNPVILSAATATVVPPLIMTLEGDMEMLRLSGEDDF